MIENVKFNGSNDIFIEYDFNGKCIFSYFNHKDLSEIGRKTKWFTENQLNYSL